VSRPSLYDVPFVSHLMDERASAGDGLDVVALQHKLILNVVGAVDLCVFKHGNVAHPLLPEEVTDLQRLAIIRDGGVDGEMGVHETHGVTETLGDTSHHVVHVAEHGANGREALGAPKPQLDLQELRILLCGFFEEHVHTNVSEALRQGAAGSLHGDDPRLKSDLHILGDLDVVGDNTRLHHFE